MEINLDGVLILFADSISEEKTKESTSKTTFNGDVNINSKNTGGNITIEGLYYPDNVEDAILLENKLNSDNIKTLTCSGLTTLANGDTAKVSIIGTGISVANDAHEWSATDAMMQKLEFNANYLQRKIEKV